MRDFQRKCPNPNEEHATLLSEGARLLQQTRTSKEKLYSVHEPQVECICKGKAHKTYEFGVKVSIASTSKGNWVVGAQA